MLAKINSVRGVVFAAALALLVSGCTPAGPRALWKGKRDLDRGDVAGAIVQFKRATTLLSTNAAAWNYLGVALQRGGQPEEAAAAYQTALRLDRDLAETHFNLGLLSLEQNRSDVARAEFTAYTLRRPNDANGWLKLAYAQLHGGDTLVAERSFSTVLSLKPNDAGAYNGLGLARLQAGKPREAAQFFAAAVQSRPDFLPALLNLATVNLQYLHDNKAALATYQACLALSPRPANYNEIKSIVGTLAQSDIATTVMAPAVVAKPNPPPQAPPEPKPKTVPAPLPRPATPIYAQEKPVFHASPHPVPVAEPVAVATETVRVAPAPEIVVAPHTNIVKPATLAPAVKHPTIPVVTEPVVAQDVSETSVPMEEQRPGFWHRLFSTNRPASSKHYHDASPAPVPPNTEEIASTKAEEKPAYTGPHYTFTSPAKPVTGDRRAAEAPFNKARLAEEDENWADAGQLYQSAADTDPAWFEAQYNAGVIAHRLHQYSQALPRYELALAIQPHSADARYNFALALKAAGYPADAAEELRKVLAANPDEVRAHLALANLCAQSLHDVPQARQHYLRVLELQPDNPQAGDIRFWLSANSK